MKQLNSLETMLLSYSLFVKAAADFKDDNDDATLHKLIDFTIIENQIMNLGEDLKAAFETIKESENGNQ